MTTSARPATYETDFYAWTQQQAQALRWLEECGLLRDLVLMDKGLCLDLANLAEEIESLGRRDYRSLESAIGRLTQHLLKWQYQPERRSAGNASWEVTINNQRNKIRQLIADSPSLIKKLQEAVSQGYRQGRKNAQSETKLPLSAFPETCPYAWEQLTDEDWLPD